MKLFTFLPSTCTKPAHTSRLWEMTETLQENRKMRTLKLLQDWISGTSDLIRRGPVEKQHHDISVELSYKCNPLNNHKVCVSIKVEE